MISLKSINLFKIKKEIHTKAAVDVHKCIKGVGGRKFFNLLFDYPTTNFGTLSRGSVNHCVIQLQVKGHMEPHNKAGSLTPAEHLVGFGQGAFQSYHFLIH